MITKENREMALMYATAPNQKKVQLFDLLFTISGKTGKTILELRKNLLLQLLKSMRHLLGYVIYASSSNLCVVVYIFYAFIFFLCCIQYTHGNLKQRERVKKKKRAA